MFFFLLAAPEQQRSQDVVVDPDPDPPGLASQHRQDGREYGTKVREETKTVACYRRRRCQSRTAATADNRVHGSHGRPHGVFEPPLVWVTFAACRRIVVRVQLTDSDVTFVSPVCDG